ncbi:MAG: DtxR family transcriptional regulator [Victivallaceae bacterium]
MDSLTQSQEDYLEAIAELSRTEAHAHSKEIADYLGVSVPSVTNALKVLADKDLINYQPYQPITLTRMGSKLADSIRARHQSLRRFFTEILRLPEAVADDAACKIEHVVSPEVTGRLEALYAAIVNCPHCRNWHADEAEKITASIPLDRLPVGARGRIAALGEHFAGRKRLADLGLVVGTELEMERPAPFGDPLRIRIKGASLALRKREASQIFVIQTYGDQP